ncbi:MAG: hypothetical protein GY737_10290 [Desulfobacteraceae bacterium]|nr:hypothetical protein [Desulfobacteraceae bacterium]
MKILIITSSIDLTCDYIIKKYGDKINFYRLNIDFFNTYEISITNNSVNIRNIFWDISLNEIHSIYYRKISFPNLTNIFEKKYHYYIHREIFSIVEGIIESFDGICLSKPSVLRKADNKIVQLKIAQEIGFNVPKLNICNSSSSLKKFLNKHDCIVKPISYGKIENGDNLSIMQTNKVDEKISSQTLSYSPAYFQKFIEKDFDLRVTIVGSKIFPVKIISKNKVDWRKEYKTLYYETFSLPQKIEKMCMQLLKQLNLMFGAIDLLFKDNEFYFLEINANGQWAWLENELNLPISNEIINLLSSKKI